MPTLICFALKEEAAPFRKIAAGRSDISILFTGIGKRNAEKSVREFLNSCRSRGDETQIKTEAPHVVSCVLTCGFAGGLNPDLKVGDVVFECGVRNAECGIQSETPHVVSCEKLMAAGARPAKFFCADRVATTVADKKKLREETGADVGEMESGAIQAVCAEHGIPCVTIRVISDTAREDLPLDFNALARPDKNIDFGKLAWTVAKSPGKIPALMKLQRQTQFAAERLAQVLAKIL